KERALHPCPTLSRESTVSSWVCWVSEDTLWKKAKDVILKPSASWSFGLLREYLKTEMARKLPGLEQIL
ncbi:TPA: hypothetical protein ACUT66_006159, partial [Pseudomonas aeruginosa]